MKPPCVRVCILSRVVEQSSLARLPSQSKREAKSLPATLLMWRTNLTVPFHIEGPYSPAFAPPFHPSSSLCSAVCKVSSHASFHCDWSVALLISMLHSMLYLTFLSGKVFVMGTSNTTYILSDLREMLVLDVYYRCALVAVLLDVSHSLGILSKLALVS